MGRGRKPTPTALKELAGNPGKRALNNQEPKPEVEIPACPQNLKGPARTEWNRVTAELVKLGILAKVDRASLAAYCQAWGDYVKASGKVAKQGEVIISDKGNLYQNPWVSIKNSAIDRFVRISSEFGMTPSSRTRIKVEKPTEEDEMIKYLFGNKDVKVKTQ